MPAFLPPGSAAFFVQPDGLPVAVLAVGLDTLSGIDLPTVETTSLATAPRVDGWSVFPQSTMTIVDGPGDNGFLVASHPTDLDASATWAGAVEARKGAVVLFVADGPAVSADQLPPTCSGAFAGLIE